MDLRKIDVTPTARYIRALRRTEKEDAALPGTGSDRIATPELEAAMGSELEEKRKHDRRRARAINEQLDPYGLHIKYRPADRGLCDEAFELWRFKGNKLTEKLTSDPDLDAALNLAQRIIDEAIDGA